jgi:hypothetical protein
VPEGWCPYSAPQVRAGHGLSCLGCCSAPARLLNLSSQRLLQCTNAPNKLLQTKPILAAAANEVIASRLCDCMGPHLSKVYCGPSLPAILSMISSYLPVLHVSRSVCMP